ncbi:MAG: hypothetical protein RI637_13445, partial [Acidimicrobiia bacterium]|nr:hypothetical protein [Acidimicrobiia bacterium]
MTYLNVVGGDVRRRLSAVRSVEEIRLGLGTSGELRAASIWPAGGGRFSASATAAEHFDGAEVVVDV